MNTSELARKQKVCHNGLIKQLYLLPGSGLSGYIFGDKESHFHLHRCLEAVPAREATRGFRAILDRFREVTHRKRRRCGEGARKAKLGGTGMDPNPSSGALSAFPSEIRLKRTCSQAATDRSTVMTGRSSTPKSKTQAACDYMLVWSPLTGTLFV